MELFAGVADMLGEGLPLAYLFITTEANAASHTKEKALVAWMEAISSLGIDPQFTLSDKDQSEISALRQVWPNAKHQLCLWHVLRALKRRLSQNGNPGSYNALEAHHAFPDIDPAFVPLGQMSAKEKVRTSTVIYYFRLIMVVQGTISPPPEKPLARIRLYVNGTAAVFTPNIKLTLKVPKAASSAVPAAGGSAWVSVVEGNGEGEDHEIGVLMEADNDDSSDGDNGLARKQAAGRLAEYEEDGQRLPGEEGRGTEEEEDELTSEEVDIIQDAERFALQLDEAASDSEDESEVDNASYSSSDEEDKDDEDFVPTLKIPKAFKATRGKQRAQKVQKDANYIFCPSSHRNSIQLLVCKHFCQHSILPERHGQPRIPQQIYRDAVLETYYHCKANNLREVWAYLWTNWYAPGKWELWARSSYGEAIPRKRTTMVVEALWRNFKRLVLYHYNRPRVDLATYALVTQGVAPYRLRFNRIVNDPRDGRAKCLRGEQIPIKKAWLALRKRPIKGVYNTNVPNWLCNCGTQKYHSYLLCKHLVQALPLPPADWWANVIRGHTAPFYDIRELLPEHERAAAPCPAALGPRYWTKRDSAPLQHSSPPTGSQNLVSGTHGPYSITELLVGVLSSKGP